MIGRRRQLREIAVTEKSQIIGHAEERVKQRIFLRTIRR
jgi:hypothetical protein